MLALRTSFNASSTDCESAHIECTRPCAPNTFSQCCAMRLARFMQVLAGELRQGIDLCLQRAAEPRIRIAEVDGRIPHLQVEEGSAGAIEQVAAFTTREDLRRVAVVDGVAMRAIARFVGQQGLLIHSAAPGPLP
ncbi:MAG: hypothetical protein WDO12_14130 [Pseudomonadota bacterium]